jgi:hypothetical protein
MANPQKAQTKRSYHSIIVEYIPDRIIPYAASIELSGSPAIIAHGDNERKAICNLFKVILQCESPKSP